MKTKTITDRDKEMLRNMAKRVSHRPPQEQADFLASFTKLPVTVETLKEIGAV